MFEVTVRALRSADATSARALVSAQVGGTSYEARVLEQLELATHGSDPECMGLVVGDEPRGLVLYGSVAGAHGVVKIHAIIASEPNVFSALAKAVRDSAARMVVYEFSADEPFLSQVGTLLDLGYSEEGRVKDFVREGMDLVVMVWRRSS